MQIHRHWRTVHFATSLVGAFIGMAFVFGLQLPRLLSFYLIFFLLLGPDRYLFFGDIEGGRLFRVLSELSVELS
jgi:hypothetical protein